MKKIFTLTLTIFSLSLSYGQYNVPLPNANVESNTAMSASGSKYSIDGMYVVENANSDSFDEVNSGLAPTFGVGGSQAFKVITKNGNGVNGVLGWHCQFAANLVDISNYGNADFIYSYQIKSTSTPAAFPIWMVLIARDEDGIDVTANTVNYTLGGNISSGAGVAGYTVGQMATDYQTAWIAFTIKSNTGGGKNAKTVDLRTQIAKYADTYYIDNLSLTSSLPQLSVKSFEKIDVNMYPNPASSFTTIKSNSGLKNISLYSMLGKRVFNKDVNTNEYQLDLSTFTKGMYMLSVSNAKGKSTTKLVVK